MKLHAVLFLQNTLLVFGQLQRPWTARDCQEVGKSFTPGWSCRSVSCHYLVCTFCCLRSLTFLGDDRWEDGGAEWGSTGEWESGKRPRRVLLQAGLAAVFLVIIYVPFAALDL